MCESKELTPLKRYRDNYLVKCKKCSFVFTSRIPSEATLNEHYATYSYGGDQYLSELTIKSYNRLLDYFEKYRKTNFILDIGCGNGFFLLEAKKRGWNIYGTEFSELAVRNCEEKGIQMKKGVLDKNEFGEIEFDVITSFEVIEHINNPRSELSNMRDLLRVGGLFYCTTPNFNSIERYLLKEKYNIINYPEHLSYYTKKTLHKLLKVNGFRKLKMETTGISLTRIRSSLKLTNQKFVSQKSDDEIIRKTIDSNKLLIILKKLLNGILSFFGLGNSLKGYFVKE